MGPWPHALLGACLFHPSPPPPSTPQYASYGATKAAIAQLLRTLQVEASSLPSAAHAPVRVHNLSPGMVLTDLLLEGATPRNKQARVGLVWCGEVCGGGSNQSSPLGLKGCYVLGMRCSRHAVLHARHKQLEMVACILTHKWLSWSGPSPLATAHAGVQHPVRAPRDGGRLPGAPRPLCGGAWRPRRRHSLPHPRPRPGQAAGRAAAGRPVL